jgi:DNA-binding winged helix-turn-helix (wHTH) protein
MKIRFADCVLDVDARRLLRGGRETHVSPKAFELLRVLVDNRGRALSKAELLERVWPGVFVSDASLARVVTEIREAVGDDARDARIIRTKHGYGYAFAATIEGGNADAGRRQDDGAAFCWMVWRKRAFLLNQGEHIVGREPGVSVWLDSPRVSRHHARVVVDGVVATIADLGSKNGTIVRGVRISSPVKLESGDEIRIGPFTLSFRGARGQGTTETGTRSR